MATIIINRTSEFLNRMRDYGIYIDGKKIDTIANGETKEFTISAGDHSLYTKIDWCGSPTQSFDINDNETKSFKVGGFKHGYWLLPTAFGISALGYIINLRVDFDFLFYLVIPVFLLLGYYITAGRNKYLTLTEIKPEPQNTIALH